MGMKRILITEIGLQELNKTGKALVHLESAGTISNCYTIEVEE